MLTGVTSSPLLSNLLEGKKQTVPVGQVPLTNTVSQNDPNVYPTTLGSPLTDLRLSDFEAIGANIQNTTLQRDDTTNKVAFADTSTSSATNIVQADFNDKSGTLSIIKADGSVITIPHFLVQTDFGVGPTGPKGVPGNDGMPGNDGFNGFDGDTGCAGATGATGPAGVPGAAGADGVQGPAGQIGQPGLAGMQGIPGEQGRYGDDGARGRKGQSCTASLGSSGPAGVSPVAAVVVSATAPTDGSLLWGKPV